MKPANKNQGSINSTL